jgi:hypothetical protein
MLVQYRPGKVFKKGGAGGKYNKTFPFIHDKYHIRYEAERLLFKERLSFTIICIENPETYVSEKPLCP